MKYAIILNNISSIVDIDMTPPILNVSFCGTNFEATRQLAASLEAIRQFDDHLILSGVGAIDCYDEKQGTHHPTPGTFVVDEKLNQHVRSPWMNRHFSAIQRGAGLLWGEGERNNLSLALMHISKKMEQVKSDETVTVNLAGYSRGGASAVHLANLLFRTYGNRVRVNLFLLDPNAGLGRQHFQFKKHIPHNVDNMYVVFNRREKIPFIQSLNIPHYFFMNPKTSVTALYVDGDHLEQEQLLENNEMSPAKTNQHLLELFYTSYGAKRTHPADHQYTFKTNEYIKKGFVTMKAQETPLDIAIRDIQSLDEKHAPKLVEENLYLAQFNQEISQLNDCNYRELSYYFSHLLSEIEQGDYKKPVEQERAALLLQATNNLINAMTPSNKCTKKQKREALEQFKSCIKKNQYNGVLMQIAAHVIGLISGVFLGVFFGVSGFFAGLTRIDTLGLASIPYAAVGAYSGLCAGFVWGKSQMLGHQNARKVEHRVNQLIEPQTDIDEFIDDAIEEATRYAKPSVFK